MIRRALLLVALLALPLAGCGSDDGTNPGSTIEGRYTLRTVNGAPVPVSALYEGATVTVQSGFIQLNSDQSFTFGLTVSATANGTTVTQSPTGVGSWIRNNNAVELDYTDGSADVATVTGDQLSMTSEGVALTFSK